MMTVPAEPFAGLTRRICITNTSDQVKFIEVLDGLPWINSYGIDSWIQKHMSRTAEAWVGVENVAANVPFFKLKVDTADKPETRFSCMARIKPRGAVASPQRSRCRSIEMTAFRFIISSCLRDIIRFRISGRVLFIRYSFR